MNIIQITPGAGGMYCGGCFRDNALVAELRKQGHETIMVPLYLPLTLDEPNQSAGMPTFFGGINVYLEQKSVLFRHAPGWLRSLLSSPLVLKLASKYAARTRAADVGDLTISMLRGEEGNQARELDDLIAWLKAHAKPDIVCLSNALLAGMARKLKTELNCPLTCLLGGEDAFIDGLPIGVRERAWQILSERCRDVDLFLSPTRYFGAHMTRRLTLHTQQLTVVPNGINVAGYQPAEPQSQPVVGYFARMCKEKGLDTLVDAYLLLKKRPIADKVRLHIGGGCGPTDEPFVEEQRRKLRDAGVFDSVKFFPNVDHAGKIAFYRGLSIFSTPARFGEAFGLYLLEALAAGVPVVQPRHAAFPELVDATGGGILCEPDDPKSLADGIEHLLRMSDQAVLFGERGREAVAKHFTIEVMARNIIKAFRPLLVRTAS